MLLISGIEFQKDRRHRHAIKAVQPDKSSTDQSRIVGSTLGRVRKLGGYQKHHHVPDGHHDAAQAFVRKIGQPDVKTAADALFNDIRELFGYKRREFDYSCEDGFAWIKTPDFDVQIKVDHCLDDTKNYILTTEIPALHNDGIASDERFHHCFTHHCDRLIIEFARPIQVDEKIDLIEDIPELEDALSYEPDGSAFQLKLPKLDLQIDVTEASMDFRLLTLRNLGKLLDHSQQAFNVLASAEFGLRLR